MTSRTEDRVPPLTGPPRRRAMFRHLVVRRCLRKPATLMITSWALFGALFLFGPLEPVTPIKERTWGVILACVLVFCYGCHVGRLSRRRSDRPSAVKIPISERRLRTRVAGFAVIGLVGGGLVVFDKLFLSGLDFSNGFTDARFRGGALGASFAASYARSPLLYIGLLSYSFSLISFTLCVLKADILPFRLLCLSTGSLLSPVAVSTVYGGRAVLLIALFMPLGALLVRRMRGQTAVKGIKPVIATLLVLTALYGAYDNSIQTDRRRYRGVTHYVTELQYTAAYRGFRAKPWVTSLIESGQVPTSLVLQGLSLSQYAVQGPAYFNLVLDRSGDVGPYYGEYEIVSMGSLLGRIHPQLNIVDRIYSELTDAKVLGVFVTSWGALYLDAGWIGLFLIAFGWGWAATRNWRRALMGDHLGAQLLACFFFVTIVASPVHSAVGAGTGTFLLLDVLITYLMLRPRQSRAVPQLPMMSFDTSSARPGTVRALGYAGNGHVVVGSALPPKDAR